MKAVFSIEISGIISIRCSDATSSSSGGVTDVRRDRGSDMTINKEYQFSLTC